MREISMSNHPPSNHPLEFCQATPSSAVICNVADRSLPHRLWHLLRDSSAWLMRRIDLGFDWYGCRYLALRQRRNLAQLDDYMLKDIGLSRADVAEEIDKGFWR